MQENGLKRNGKILVCKECRANFRERYQGTNSFCNTSCSARYRVKQRVFSPDKHFWKFVKKTPTCWEWTRAIGAHGYGVISYQKKGVLTHRFSYMLAHGKIPKNKHVLHSCDNRKCVNPKHLCLGTNLDNIHDRMKKGRKGGGISRPGESNLQAKLTEKKVREIKLLRSLGHTFRGIAKKFSVSSGTVYKIVTHKTWIHIT